jgi:murein DD-endopeptidase MepM/ murein hydrolase activator NlpD
MANHPKIGFLTSGAGGNPSGIGQYANVLNAANIPAVIFCNDGMVGISDALATGGDHVLLYRIVKDGTEQWSVPDYNLLPKEAAAKHWNKLKPQFHPDFVVNKGKVWLQPINEVDKGRSDWLGNFALEFATIANWEGYKVAMFAWSSGEPEPGHWRTAGMVNYLKYCAAHKEMAAVALHEYSYGQEPMPTVYPWHIGRFQELYKACDELGIKRPYVLISEFGWSYDSIPAISRCLEDVAFAAELYAKYPDVLGAVIWYLGPGFNNIANAAQQLITHITDFTLNTTFPDTEEPPMTTWEEELWQLAETKKVLAYKKGAALQEAIKADGLQARTNEFLYTRPDGAVLVCRGAIDIETADLYVYYCFVPNYSTVYRLEEDAGGTPMPTPFSGYDSPVGTAAERASATIWPGAWVDVNPMGSFYHLNGKDVYHTGTDANLPNDQDAHQPVYSTADGVVTFAGKEASTWGNVVVIRHSGQPTIWSRSAHLEGLEVSSGDSVKKGQIIGRVGNANNQLPFHLHYDLAMTNIMETIPGHWPGGDLNKLKQNYVEPRALILISKKGFVNKPMVIKSAANFRAGPKTSFLIYETLTAGTKATVMGDVDDYALCKVGAAYGFVHLSLLGDDQPVPPTPPNKIDLLPYLKGDGRLYTVKHADGQQENFQSQTATGNVFYLVKNSQYEQFMYDDNFIYRGYDTSAGPAPPYAERPGKLRYYRQFEQGKQWAKWCPRFMAVGETWTGPGHIVEYFYKDNCEPSTANSGGATNKVTLRARHFNKVWNGVTISDCVDLFTGTTSEGMFFGRGWSLVSWGNQEGGASAVWERLPEGTPSLVREIIPCL